MTQQLRCYGQCLFFCCFVHADRLVLRHIFSNVTTAEQLRHLANVSCTFISMCCSSEDGETASRGCFAAFETLKYILEKFRWTDKGWNQVKGFSQLIRQVRSGGRNCTPGLWPHPQASSASHPIIQHAGLERRRRRFHREPDRHKTSQWELFSMH